MPYNVRLRAGFFKTQPYVLDIVGKQIVLYPKHATDMEKFVIDEHDLNTISIIKGIKNLTEFEIKTQTGIYIGIIDSRTNLEELLCDLTREFGRKFIINGRDS
ncbi:MAG TPA: hypothetical protein GXX58_02395 [Gelria sp.]|jgi:hypothetical protein|nr:hypothetical protein [Gelria sp.]